MSRARCRQWTAVVLLVTVIVGLGSKFYQGWGQDWINNSLGGVIYEIAWCLLGFYFWPTRRAIWQVPLWVFGVTCCLEVLQLWHPAWLEAVRANLLGRLLLGTTFVWSDFGYYVIGCVLGWLVLRSLAHQLQTP
jgi:hypothetical protein